jgi:hypothetical protein
MYPGPMLPPSNRPAADVAGCYLSQTQAKPNMTFLSLMCWNYFINIY